VLQHKGVNEKCADIQNFNIIVNLRMRPYGKKINFVFDVGGVNIHPPLDHF
jgi:hypothetical protein